MQRLGLSCPLYLTQVSLSSLLLASSHHRFERYYRMTELLLRLRAPRNCLSEHSVRAHLSFEDTFPC